MTDEKKRGLYRIGDYAHFMGVSTDLLKHYEKMGLIRAETGENGYRYYPFQESIALLECKRLQNYGLSLREMHQVLREASYNEVKQVLDGKIDDMEKQLQFQQMVIDEHRRISAWMEMMQDCDTKVIIKDVEPVYFLPQSKQRDFIHDKRIGDILDAWIDAMPMVKSCCLLPLSDQDERFSWGLAATKSQCEALNLPMNDVVQCIDGGRYLHLHFRHFLHGREGWRDALSLMTDIVQQYDVKPGASMLQFSLMRLGMEKERVGCGWFCVPLQSDGEANG